MSQYLEFWISIFQTFIIQYNIFNINLGRNLVWLYAKRLLKYKKIPFK
jgi:hypothetical protein